MHVVVLTKSTPDTAAKVSVEDGKPTWKEAMVINPWDEYSVTEAVLLKDAHKVKATIMTVGPEEHGEALKQGLAIGCDQAVRVWDDQLADHDSLQYAKVAAAAIQKLDDVSLVLFGKEFADSNTDQHVFQVARKLGWPVLGAVAKILEIDFAGGTIKVERLVEQGKQVVTSKLPIVLSVLKDINEPKYPSFIGIRKAAKAKVPVWDLAELGIDIGATQVTITEYKEPPTQEAEVEIIDGDSPNDIATKLADKLMEEKVI
ncbi:MAG: electron transfer flavoprotein subunit beta/FixA family protein [Chloroflexi bacterium]|nr:electron transfer flavoprotein subunit beta/FixA family protein [Chloroflexota bacterium]